MGPEVSEESRTSSPSEQKGCLQKLNIVKYGSKSIALFSKFDFKLGVWVAPVGLSREGAGTSDSWSPKPVPSKDSLAENRLQVRSLVHWPCDITHLRCGSLAPPC